MQTRLQLTLLVAAAVYMAWALSLLFSPELTHHLISNAPYDHAVTSMFAAALIGFCVTFLIAARDPVKEIVRASAAGMAVIGFTAAFLIFGDKSMPLSPVTVGSLLVDLVGAAILFLTEAKLDLLRHAQRGKRAA